MRGPLDSVSYVGLFHRYQGLLRGLESAAQTEAGVTTALLSPPELGIFPFMGFLPTDHMGPSDLPAA